MKKIFLILQILECSLFMICYLTKKEEVVFGASTQSGDWLEKIVVVAFFIVMVLLQYIFYSVSKEKLRQELEMKDLLYKGQEKYYKLLLKREYDTQKIRHDMRNHMLCLHELLYQEQYNKSMKYLEEYMEQLSSIDYVIQTGNNIMDIIVNDIHNRYSVDINFRGIFPAHLVMNDVDLCVIFSNLFSNAAEATEKTKDAEIEIMVRNTSNGLIVKIKNPVKEKLIIKNNRIGTTKKNKKEHGFGMMNINSIVQKYHGKIIYQYKENFFYATVILSNIF